MSWRKITESDLLSALSGAETEAFRQSADFETEPVERQIADATALVRGYIRSGGKTKLSADPEALPSSLVGPTVDYLRFRLLTRMDITPNEARTKAYDDAKALFEAIRRGDYVPESDGVDETGATAGPAAEVVLETRQRVSAAKLEGL